MAELWRPLFILRTGYKQVMCSKKATAARGSPPVDKRNFRVLSGIKSPVLYDTIYSTTGSRKYPRPKAAILGAYWGQEPTL